MDRGIFLDPAINYWDGQPEFRARQPADAIPHEGAFCKIRQVAGIFTGKGKGTGQSRDKSALYCIMEMPHPHDERRANLPLKQTLSRHWFRFQRELFPWLEEALGPLGERYERLVRVLELVRVEESLPYNRGWRGRPLQDRSALARAFLARRCWTCLPPGRWWSG